MLNSEAETGARSWANGSDPAGDTGTTRAGAQPAPRQLTAAEMQFAVAFTRVLSVLMRSNPYRNLPLTQIQGLVVPAIMTGQFAIMDAEVNGQLTPIAVAFWAHVSTEVDQRLSDTSIAVPKLGPNDWKSGDIPWLLDVVGHPQAAQQLITQLNAGPFAGRDVRVRRRTVDGLMTVERLLDLDIGTSNGTGSAFDQQ